MQQLVISSYIGINFSDNIVIVIGNRIRENKHWNIIIIIINDAETFVFIYLITHSIWSIFTFFNNL